MPEVEWYARLPVENSRNALDTDFYELIQVDGLHQFVDLRTRLGTTGGNVLDLLFAYNTDLVEHITNIPSMYLCNAVNGGSADQPKNH